MSLSRVDDCRLVQLPRINRPEGSITPVEGGSTIPFEIARVYYVYDVVQGASRGGHAHRALQQLIVAVMSRFVVTVDDGRSRRSIELDRADQGLYIPPMIWRELEQFSSGAVCVVLASLPYDEGDYIRRRAEFVELRRLDEAAAQR
jgi:dTDP-4-dehydrorhamnose 3,5-epimerase-like enzyme